MGSRNTTTAYLYKWIQVSTNKWYIGSKTEKGCHPSGHEKYICSSKIVKPLVLENRQDWTYKILVIGEPKYIREVETLYLKKLNARDDSQSFNESNGGLNMKTTLGRKDSKETKKKKSEMQSGKKNHNYGLRGPLCPLYGRSQTQETKEKKRKSQLSFYLKKPRTEEHNQKISKGLKNNPKVLREGKKNGNVW